MTLRLLSASRLRAARTCARLHQYQYELGYRPVEEARALRFGTLVHRGLEAWWLAVQADQPQEAWLDAALDALAGEADPYDAARAQVLLTGYHVRWKDEPYEVLAVEAKFEAPLINPESGAPSRTWRLAGKVDAVVRDKRDGLVRLVEHKTSSDDLTPGSPYFARLRLDSQVSVYFAGAKALGFDVAGCLYDVLGKPRHRPLEANSRRAEPESPEAFRERLGAAVAEEPSKYFQRAEVVRLEGELREFDFDTWQQAKLLREIELAGVAPRNGDACVRFNRVCPYLEVCSGSASLEDERLFRRAGPHPELVEPAASP